MYTNHHIFLEQLDFLNFTEKTDINNAKKNVEEKSE